MFVITEAYGMVTQVLAATFIEFKSLVLMNTNLSKFVPVGEKGEKCRGLNSVNYVQ